MAQLRPSITLNNGRVQMPLRVDIQDLMVANPLDTFLTADNASGLTTLTVKSIVGFAINQLLLIGNPGQQGTEIVKTHASSAPSGFTITLAAATVYPHSASTFVYLISADQVEFSRATTVAGSKSVLATSDITVQQQYTEYLDASNTSGYYFARYKNTITGTFSQYSGYVLYEGYAILSAGAIIAATLEEINKKKSDTLSDVFFFTQLDNCQTETIRDLKRWSFMQKFDAIIGQAATGSWKVAMPTDIDDQNTNKSIYTLRVGTQQRMTWVDKSKFDEFLVGVAYNTLSVILNVADATMTLSDSSDFAASGSVTIGAYTYDYTANNTTTGVLTLTSVVPASQNQAIGADVFQGVTQGLPTYWTTYGGYIYYWPAVSSTYNLKNLYMNYYIAQTRMTDYNSLVVFPDPTVAIYYLGWKALKKLNSGEETEASLEYKNNYIARKQKMKDKEVLGRTFKLKPRIQNFAIQSEFSEDTPRWIRDANFPNTGF